MNNFEMMKLKRNAVKLLASIWTPALHKSVEHLQSSYWPSSSFLGSFSPFWHLFPAPRQTLPLFILPLSILQGSNFFKFPLVLQAMILKSFQPEDVSTLMHKSSSFWHSISIGSAPFGSFNRSEVNVFWRSLVVAKHFRHWPSELKKLIFLINMNKINYDLVKLKGHPSKTHSYLREEWQIMLTGKWLTNYCSWYPLLICLLIYC